jgi:ferritin-like protein
MAARRTGAEPKTWYHPRQQFNFRFFMAAKEIRMANEGYHEPVEELSEETRDMHRAIISLMEELEAVDWYNQRVDACKDKELAAILAHNRDEEKEHAAMVLEWIRRRDPRFDKELKDYLFTTEEIAHE